MNLFWHKDASLTEKICAILWYAFFFLFIYAFFTNFTPSEFSYKYSPYIVLICTVIYFFPSLGLMRKFPNLSLSKKIIASIFWFVVTYAAIFQSLTVAIPSILIGYFGNDYKYEGVIVEKKNRGDFNRRGCNHEIRVDGYYLFLGGLYLCVSKDVWHSVDVNHKVVLSGKEFILGKKVTRISASNQN